MIQIKWYARGIGQGYTYTTRVPSVGERLLIESDWRRVVSVDHYNTNEPWPSEKLHEFVAAAIEVA